MTVKELREQLEGLDDELEVKFSYNYGDHWRTKVAANIDSMEEMAVEYSDYHNMDKVVDDEDMYDEETGELKKNVRMALVLS